MQEKGYKHTDVGDIPVGWDIARVGEVFTHLRNNSLSRDNLGEEGEIMNIHYGDILVKYGEIIDASVADLPYINPLLDYQLTPKTEIKDGDIIVTDTAEDETVGKASEIINCNNKHVVSGLHTIALRPDKITFAPKYLGYFFNSGLYHEQLRPSMQGIKVLSISKTAIDSTYIIYPTDMLEQERIARVLSDIDSLLEDISLLITKKNEIKTGVMQLLLTGKLRINGYCNPWVTDKIENIAPLQRGFDLPTSQIKEGNVPVVYSNGICNYHNKGKCKAPGLVTGRSGTIGHFTYIPSGEYWPHNTSLWVTSFFDNYPLYIYYIYSTLKFENFMGGSGVPTLNRNDIHEIEIKIPNNRNEQESIAEILNDIDLELKSLGAKFLKYKDFKKGMMQQLLTGKMRLL